MKISKKTEYAVKALVQMAQRTREGSPWQQISQIAEVTHIPEKFLEQILLNLKNAGFLKSRRGIAGGYSLNLPEEQITLDRLVLALEGPPPFIDLEKEGTDSVMLVLAKALTQAEEASLILLRNKSLSGLVDEVQAKDADPSLLEYQI